MCASCAKCSLRTISIRTWFRSRSPANRRRRRRWPKSGRPLDRLYRQQYVRRWLIDNARQAQVYAELAGVNNVVIESTDNYKAMLKNLAFTLSLYSGQMCTTTQDIFVPAGGIDTDEGHKSFDDVASDLGRAVDKLLSDAAVATAVLGSIQSPDTLKRIEDAPALRADVVLASRKLDNAEFPAANVHTPLLMKTDAANESAYTQERFGPISLIVKVSGRHGRHRIVRKNRKERGALTVGLYSTKPEVIEAMTEAHCAPVSRCRSIC